MILALIFGFVTGIWVASFVRISIGIFILCVIVVIVLYFFRNKFREKHRIRVVVASIFILGAILGMGRMAVSNLRAYSQLYNVAYKKISALGIVVDEPDVRETNTQLTVRLSQVSSPTSSFATTSVSEKILLTAPLYPEFHYGDKIFVDMTLVKPRPIDSGDGRVFDYQDYLRVRDIWYTARSSRITLVSPGHGAVIQNGLFTLKEYFTSALNRALPQPESSLMAGLLIGAKQSLGKALLAEFQRAGVSHVVVLSGYNIVIVAEGIIAFLSFAFAFLPKNLTFGLGAVSVVLFTLASGGGASAWRAAIMVLVALFATRTNREYSPSKALGFAIILMLIWNPLLLVFDPSFQLSVLATLGLIYVSPYVAPFLKRVPEKYGLREIISSTIATQIIVLPFLIYTTGILSLISLPVNILILGTIPLTMFLGFLTGVIGLFSLYLSFIPAFFAYVLLWYQLAVVHIGATLPFGAITLPAFSPAFLVLVYGIIFAGLYYLKKKK